jgi:5-methylcytosine-specific restriction protein A
MPIRPPQHKPLWYKPVTERKKESDERRGTAHERGYGHKWRKARESFIKANPLCVECAKADIVEPATVVDHIIPHKGDIKLFWDRKNWQPLCKQHHDRKTMNEGSFGR